ncbi:MAG: 4-hydroxythreonine-4-phosphate dehydrogenase PdxA [Verrucomicrobiota bacterium]
MSVDHKLPIAITCGDPAGVGPELIEALLKADSVWAGDYVVIGPRRWLETLADRFGVSCAAVSDPEFVIEPRAPSIEGAAVALAAMEAAAQGCRNGSYRGVVTGPVSKHWLKQVGFAFPGQTEFFAKAWGGDPTMAFVGEKLRVVLATWHIPLREVPDALNAVALEKAVRRANELGQQLGISEPRIGVCGLNPHAGEGGILGTEERDLLDPALDRLRVEFRSLSKCLPGDTVFTRQLKGDFDVVVAAYHDQGLAAVKTLEFDSAVNITLGLPFLRTSPDHGTAFDIAGKGLADQRSFVSAIRLLRELTA